MVCKKFLGLWSLHNQFMNDNWHFLNNGIIGRFYTKDQNISNLWPDDPTFKWHYYYGDSETNSGDVNIQGI